MSYSFSQTNSMNSELYDAISVARSEAEKILQNLRRKKHSPIDVEKIAKKYGIEIVRGQFSGKDGQHVSGVLKIDENGPIIAIQSSESIERQRFTIAHEVCHFLLHKSEKLYIDHKNSEVATLMFRDENSSNASSVKEIQANQFAAELLMPSEEIREYMKERITKESNDESVLDLIKELASMYQVSAAAMTIKIGRLAEQR